VAQCSTIYIMSNKDRTPEVDTALHVIKGAIVKVLHTPITVTTASKKNEGRLTVEYELGKITDEQLKKMTPEQFYKLPKWKQLRVKQESGVF